MNIRGEERLASWIVVLAVLWGLHVELMRISAGDGFLLPVTQLEVVGIGVLVWLHAKWRRSITAR